jgi:hypothetical protein
VSQDQQPVESFRELAASYCALVEGIEALERDKIHRRLAVLLPSLMSAAALLPDLDPTSGADAPEISHEVWFERFAAIGGKLGGDGGYWTTMHVHGSSEPKVINLALADDLADIWRDLRGGLDLLASGGEIADAVWEWRFGFKAHWGTHAAEALRAVHAWLRD